MLRAFERFLRRGDDPARRLRRRCIPSLSERASTLEDRVLLSAAGGKAQAAEVARNPADTRAGKEVTNLFASILQTNPTGAQLTHMVHELRSGMSVAALRRDLTAEARGQQGIRVPMDVVSVNGGPSAPVARTTGTAGGGVTIPKMPGLSGSTSPGVARGGVSQIPTGMSISLNLDPGPTSGVGGPAATPMPANPSPMPPMMSPMPTMGGMSPSGGMSMPTMVSPMTGMGSTAAMAGTASNISSGMGTPAMLPVSPMPITPFSSNSGISTGM